MKAIRVYEPGDPEVMKLEDVTEPQAGPGQVVVQIQAIGVNPVDTYIRLGKQGYSPSYPYTPGFDAAGVIEAVGEDVAEVQVGDRVYCAGTISGAYAEKALCAEKQVHSLPDHVSFAQGAAVSIPYGTAYRALFQRAQAKAGDIVLIHGASGGVGLAAIQLARAAGMTVIGTAGTGKSQQLIRERGAHHVLDHHQPDHLEQAVELIQGQKVNVILEMLANVNLGRDLPILAQGGRVVVIGSRGDVTITPRDLMGRDADILGMALKNTSPTELAGIHAALVAGLENGTLCPVVGRELPLTEAAQAHHDVIESSAYGKIVLIP
ncbi:quinone oxidoreductase [candidate division KSB3 bacterium]|uniref:Quinone oxidoreductase n=1 Tax=candidate division KSB3 bacterium TaxID=2044937 RepID=A0A2G6KEM0_9BACT|nr:MAG: quinone oxidoreductase [candidate division KSB3 bacterium]